MTSELETQDLAHAREAQPERRRPQFRMLRPLAVGFRLGVELRAAAYRRGLLKTQRLNRPVISVGNLTVGGAGKTPLVEWLARILLQHGRKPGILTRGYGRRRGIDIIALEPKPGRTPDARLVGDEPAWLARTLPEVPIVVSADRHRGGRVAEDCFGVDLHLLDDGFSHLALGRDVDVVALDSTEELSDQAVLPAGRQREPCSALTRADFLVLTRTELADPAALEARVREINPRAGVFHGRTRLRRLVEVPGGAANRAEASRGEPVHAFCGIGNPEAFFQDLRSWGFVVADRAVFRDHHVYSAAELERLGARARERGAAALLTTEKDTMNFPAAWQSDVPVVCCAIQTEIDEAQAFEAALLARLQAT